MGKTLRRLEKQLNTEHRKDAEDCIAIYNALKEMNNGHVWSSQWQPLVCIEWLKPYPNPTCRYWPSSMGRVFLEGLKQES